MLSQPADQPLVVRTVGEEAGESEQKGQYWAQLSNRHAESFSDPMISSNSVQVSDSSHDEWLCLGKQFIRDDATICFRILVGKTFMASGKHLVPPAVTSNGGIASLRV